MIVLWKRKHKQEYIGEEGSETNAIISHDYCRDGGKLKLPAETSNENECLP